MLLAALLLQAAPLPVPPPPGDEPGCDRNAIRYTAEREWRGIWANDFEGSRFFEGTAEVATLPWRARNIWFDDRKRAAFNDLPSIQTEFGKAYRVRFVGKASVEAPPGQRCGFGHMGMSDGEVIVTRILSIEPLGDLRPR
ncbi:hypothetical protein QLH51_18200 [Sphingomonas sp. 2R-10]|uniref:hypothetical protein n=1 Tax=Sphingomonas sp. 2R-10 TaxID=3045148 RepID=UPI000F77CA5F|nr:hypothetical protein [Sphingomonas sp. 2R-10]MDJ0278728.1 hypothetical protein [Sphingomonas sp. 2R-10]